MDSVLNGRVVSVKELEESFVITVSKRDKPENASYEALMSALASYDCTGVSCSSCPLNFGSGMPCLQSDFEGVVEYIRSGGEDVEVRDFKGFSHLRSTDGLGNRRSAIPDELEFRGFDGDLFTVKIDRNTRGGKADHDHLELYDEEGNDLGYFHVRVPGKKTHYYARTQKYKLDVHGDR